MFVVAELRDSVRVAPDTFDRELLEVLAEELDKKYANKVLVDIGLCLCVLDFKEVQDAIIYPSDGAAHHRVLFRMVVFKPFVGEILIGTITGSNDEGIHVSLEFFDDVFIPRFSLPVPSVYNQREKTWTWRFDPDSEEEDAGGIFTNHEQIRFRVDSITFTKVCHTDKGRQATHLSTDKPTRPSDNATAEDRPRLRQRATSVDLSADAAEDPDPPVMHIKGGVNEDGLGLVLWNWE